MRGAVAGVSTAPLVVADGFVTHEPSGRRAGSVLVYGVDERFWSFHGLSAPGDVMVSPALARELSIAPGDVLLTRLQKPSAIPIESLFGRKDDVGRTVRLTVAGVLAREQLGEFALKPQQSEVRAVFAPLRRIQRDLGVAGKVNTVLIAGGDEATALRRRDERAHARGSRRHRVGPSAIRPMLAVESGIGDTVARRSSGSAKAAQKLGLAPVPVFTYLANTHSQGRSADPVLADHRDRSLAASRRTHDSLACP